MEACIEAPKRSELLQQQTLPQAADFVPRCFAINLSTLWKLGKRELSNPHMLVAGKGTALSLHSRCTLPPDCRFQLVS